LPRFNDSKRFPRQLGGSSTPDVKSKGNISKGNRFPMVFLQRTGGRGPTCRRSLQAEQISRGLCNETTYVLREHTGWLFFYLVFYFSSSFPCTSFAALSLPFSLSLSHFFSRSLFLLHSTTFIIKIKCKIVPRTSFPNGIKLRARFSFSLHYHYTRGRIDSSFLDRIVFSHFIYSSRVNERAVFRRFSGFLFSTSRFDVKVLRTEKAIRDLIFSSFKELRILRI